MSCYISESDRYTESMSSCLEYQNYQVIGQMPPPMPSQTTKVKHGMTTSLVDISISSPDSVLCWQPSFAFVNQNAALNRYKYYHKKQLTLRY